MRLVVDKSRKKHIPSSRNCERIDFNNYIQGGYYSIPQAVKDESLIGRKFVVFDVRYNTENGEHDITKPVVVEYVKWKRWDEWLIDLHTVNDGRLLDCNWYRSIDMCVYDYDNKESALLDYNNQVSNMIKAREKYITDMLQKELGQFDKHFVKRVSYKKEYK